MPTSPTPAAIQPHGVLLSLDATDPLLCVVMASANTGPMLGMSVEEVIGRPVAELLGSHVAARVGDRVAAGYPSEPVVMVVGRPLAGALGGREVDLRVQGSGDRAVVELEPRPPGSASAIGDRSARSAMTRLADTATMPELTGLLARELRELSGFDRVLVYRFDGHQGDILAEARREDLDPALGLLYPGHELPAQTRRLYELDPIRLIVDLGHQPVPLVPALDPGTGTPLDLSRMLLRTVLPMHVEYLTRLGVTASMSVSIMVDDQLWGLVVCHHYSGPHCPSQDARAASEFVTEVASHLIAHRERADARYAAVDTQSALAALCARLTALDGNPLDALFADPALLSIFGATGAAQLFDGVLRTAGVVPERAVMEQINLLLNDPDSYLSCTDHLAALDPGLAAVADIAAGVLRVGTLGDRWGLWFRPEQREVVGERAASGPPDKTWHDDLHGYSQRWEPWESEAAEELGRHINSLLLLRSREQVAMAESMQRSVVLDRAPAFDGIELVARYRPASSYQLGGDWWDAFELDERRLAFVVGDVAGHGVAAASAMTQVRTALRAYLYEGHSPAECLDRLDRLMDGLLGVGVATALVAVLDRDAHQVEIASAGHPDPILIGADGVATEIELDRRPLLGVGMGQAPTSYVDLPPDALLLLFTDGLVERRGADMDKQTARLLDLAASRTPTEDVEAWLDRLLAELDTTDDDTTMLAIGRQD